MSDDADQPPEQFPEVHNYEVLLVHRNGNRVLRVIMAKRSVDAIQLALNGARGEHGDVARVSCKEVA